MLELMSVEDYAAARKWPISTVRTWCKANILPSFKMGRKWQIDVLAADKVISDRIAARVAPPKDKPAKKPTIINRKKNPGNSYLERLAAI